MHASGRQFGLSRPRQSAFAPKIYYFNPLLAGPRGAWAKHLDRCQDLGFDCLVTAPLFAPDATGDIFLTGDYERCHPVVAGDLPPDTVIADLAIACQQHGLQLFLDIVVGRVGVDAAVAKLNPHWFAPAPIRLDPRSSESTHAAYACFDNSDAADELAEWWGKRLQQLVGAGAVGFRCVDAGSVPPDFWRRIIGITRQSFPGCRFLAWTLGVPWHVIQGLRDVGFSGAFSSLPWWDGRSPWLAEEHRLLRNLGAVIGLVEAPFERCSGDRNQARSLRLAAAIGSGLLMPMGYEFGLSGGVLTGFRAEERIDLLQHEIVLRDEIREANALSEHLAALDGEIRILGDPQSPVMALLRTDSADVRRARSGVAVLINTLQQEQPVPIQVDPLPSTSGIAASAREVISGKHEPNSVLQPGEIRLLKVLPTSRIKTRREKIELSRAASASRIVIDNVAPTVDAGRFAARRIVGQAVVVEADVFSDGHEELGVELLWRAADKAEWKYLPMSPLSNDRWQAIVVPDRIGRYEFLVQAWWNRYGTFVRDLDANHKAGADIGLEILEGRQLLEQARQRAEGSESKIISSALNWLNNSSADDSVEIFRTADLREVMFDNEERQFLNSSSVFAIEVERPQAAFASWYELFPRSATESNERHGTLTDVIGRLPAIRDMGFDVLYLTPIHPIGRTNRKGKNNSLDVGRDDVGSPYAIGNAEGGHTAIHPLLGSLEDFRRLNDAAAAHGLEIALDFAVQCSPDHPWLMQHPEWFSWRPDGSLRYAENPPKKYQDIVNVDFYGPKALPGLWTALRDIVLFWVDEGVRIFRVDNPHTKPLPFWEWLIAEIRSRYPDVIFLSEAFTRPKMMYRLAKVGFSQSYSYFTWRNTKSELVDYFTELTTTDVKDYFRPHLFVNTPDINPYFLQTSGRPGFLARAALAATLSGLWGIYSGFEICESAPLPGREEYLDSEKYQIRARDYTAAGNIVAEIAKLNRIRREYPVLHSHLGVRFYAAHDDQVVLYGKMTAGRRSMILIAVSVDPFHVHDVTIEVPLWELDLPDDASVTAEDLMRETTVEWRGKLQRVSLDPAAPFAIWHLDRGGR